MPDSILLTPDSRLLNGSGPADFANYGAQPDPVVSFAPAPTDSPAIDPLGIATPAQQGGAAPEADSAPVLLDQSLAFLPDAAAPLPVGSSAPTQQFDTSSAAVQQLAASPIDTAASPSPMGGGSLAPTPFLPILEEQGSGGSIANALTPTSLDAGTIGSAVPLLDPVVSNVAALTQPVGTILTGLDDALVTPVTSGVVAPLTDEVVASLVSNVAAPLVEGVADAAQPAVAGLVDVAEPVLAGVTSAVAPAVETISSVAGAVAAPVVEAATPVADTLTATVAPIAEAAAPVAQPVAEAASTIAGPAVDAGIATLVDLVQAADMIVPTPAGAEPLLVSEDTSGSIVETLASPDPEDSLLGINADDGSGTDDGDNDGPLSLGG